MFFRGVFRTVSIPFLLTLSVLLGCSLSGGPSEPSAPVVDSQIPAAALEFPADSPGAVATADVPGVPAVDALSPVLTADAAGPTVQLAPDSGPVWDILEDSRQRMEEVDSLAYEIEILGPAPDGGVPLLRIMMAGEYSAPDRERASVRFNVPGVDLEFEIVFVSGRFYTRESPDGEWVMEPPSSGAPQDLAMYRTMNFSLDRESSPGMELLGPVDLDGRMVHHIRGPLDSEQVGDFLSGMEIDVASAVIEYWIGVDGLLVHRSQMEAEVSSPALNSGSGLSLSHISVLVRFSRHGESFDIRAPEGLLDGLPAGDPPMLEPPVLPDVFGVAGCDDELKGDLSFGRSGGLNLLIVPIVQGVQERYPEDCGPETWNPQVDNAGGTPGPGACFEDEASAEGVHASVGGQIVPAGLRLDEDPLGMVRRTTWWDGGGNGIIYWGGPGLRPGDGAACWLYAADSGSWFSG